MPPDAPVMSAVWPEPGLPCAMSSPRRVRFAALPPTLAWRTNHRVGGPGAASMVTPARRSSAMQDRTVVGLRLAEHRAPRAGAVGDSGWRDRRAREPQRHAVGMTQGDEKHGTRAQRVPPPIRAGAVPSAGRVRPRATRGPPTCWVPSATAPLRTRPPGPHGRQRPVRPAGARSPLLRRRVGARPVRRGGPRRRVRELHGPRTLVPWAGVPWTRVARWLCFSSVPPSPHGVSSGRYLCCNAL